MSKKSAKKSANRVPGNKPFQKGHDARRGRGPKKGAPNAGRPTLEYLQFIRECLRDPKHQKTVTWILTHKNHPAFASVLGKFLFHHLGVPKAQEGADGEARYVLMDV